MMMDVFMIVVFVVLIIFLAIHLQTTPRSKDSRNLVPYPVLDVKIRSAVVDQSMCNFAGKPMQTFKCTSIFDSEFYVWANNLTINVNNALQHYKDVGISMGYPFHPGDRILKIILVTKNEWPLLESWIQYHGMLVGFNNIYVISSDTDIRCINYLTRSSKVLGYNYFKSDPRFPVIEYNMVELGNNLRYTADFITKLDTDEYLSYYDGSLNRLTSKEAIQQHLNEIDYDGGSYNFTFMLQNIPNEAHCLSSYHPMLNSDKFMFTSSVSSRKAIIPLPTFAFIDTGNHISRPIIPYNTLPDKETKLMIIDYHYQCYEKVVMNNLKALRNRGFVLPNDSTSVQIEKLRSCGDKFPKVCACPSCHKVSGYLRHLREPLQTRNNYYNMFRKWSTVNVSTMVEFAQNHSVLAYEIL